MDPMTAIMMGASGLGSLGSLFFRNDPSQQFGKTLGNVQQMINPALLQRYAAAIYQNYLRSPAYSNTRMGVLQGAAAGQRGVMRSLAARGLNTTGIGALANVGAGAGGLRLGSLHSQAWNDALQQAQQLLSTQVGVAGGLPRPTTAADQYAGFNDALMRMMMAYSLRNGQTKTSGKD